MVDAIAVIEEVGGLGALGGELLLYQYPGDDAVAGPLL